MNEKKLDIYAHPLVFSVGKKRLGAGRVKNSMKI